MIKTSPCFLNLSFAFAIDLILISYYEWWKLFLFSEHILCKESIVIVKKFDFGIFHVFIHLLRSPQFIYAIFAVMYASMCVCEWTR